MLDSCALAFGVVVGGARAVQRVTQHDDRYCARNLKRRMQAMRRNCLQARIFSQEPVNAILSECVVATCRVENHELVTKALPQQLLDR
jgi:hypothetical protein